MLLIGGRHTDFPYIVILIFKEDVIMGFTEFLAGLNKSFERHFQYEFDRAEKEYNQATWEYDHGQISFSEYERRAQAALKTMEYYQEYSKK